MDEETRPLRHLAARAAAGLLGTVVLFAVLVPAAGARTQPRRLSESQVRHIENALLGPQHAADHAAVRMESRLFATQWARMSARARRSYLDHETTEFAPYHCPATICGSWDEPDHGGPFGLPDFAIHAALLANGDVMLWGYPYVYTERYGLTASNHGDGWLWNPRKGYGPTAFTSVPPPNVAISATGVVSSCSQDPVTSDCRPAPIYCVGESLLANGDLFIAGGNLNLTDQAGLDTTFTFDPTTMKWHQQGSMAEGRWYPGQVELPSGRIAIVGGYTATGNTQNNSELDIWPSLKVPPPDSTSGAQAGLPVSEVPSAAITTALYPHLFTLPSGKVLLAGPGNGDSGLLNFTSLTWTRLPTLPGGLDRIGGNAVLLPGTPKKPSSTVMELGGYDYATYNTTGTARSTTTTATIDAAAKRPQWKTGSSQAVGRSYGNTVLLPDSSMVSFGGGAGRSNSTSPDGSTGTYWDDGDGALKSTEIYSPKTKRWTTGPAEQQYRTYHSVALLLPNGSVFSAGDDFQEYAFDESQHGGSAQWYGNAEIYKPWYLQGQRRPRLAATPEQILAGETFTVGYSGGTGRPSRFELVEPSATTHGADMTQRIVPLRFHVSGHLATITAPPNMNVAPPGYYMLVALDHHDIPSDATGHFVQLLPANSVRGRVSQVGPTTATLRGTIAAPHETTWYFRYGTSPTSLRHQTVPEAVYDRGSERVTARIAGLTRGTKYYFRLVTTNGTAKTMTVTFRTSSR